jgi:hypothetical protein
MEGYLTGLPAKTVRIREREVSCPAFIGLKLRYLNSKIGNIIYQAAGKISMWVV